MDDEEILLSDTEKAIYEMMAEDERCEYRHGSLFELKNISQRIGGKKPVLVYILDDGWKEDGQLYEGYEGQESARSAEANDERIYCISPDERHEPTPRKLRHLTAWIKDQYRHIHEGIQLDRWIEERRPPMPADIHRFFRWYYFLEMTWHGRPVTRIFYNRRKRRVYLQLGQRL